MILRYVTSYVSKWHDAHDNDALYSSHVTPYQAAYRHVKELKPCEPEMWLFLSSMKLSWSKSRTKDFVAPVSTNVSSNKVHDKYLKRDKATDTLSFVKWLRRVNHTSAKPKAYKGGETLVGVRMRNPLSDEYFFQEILMNYAHRATAKLYDDRDVDLPTRIRFFVSAVRLMPSLWKDTSAIKARFERLGHKAFYVNTLLSYIARLHDTLHMWQKKVFPKNDLSCFGTRARVSFELDHIQSAIVDQVMQSLHERDEFYNTINCFEDLSDSEVEEIESDFVAEGPEVKHTSVDWRKFTLLTGKPGTGKSDLLIRVIEECLREERSVLVATPTGILATHYRDLFDDEITSDTVKSTNLASASLDKFRWTNSKLKVSIFVYKDGNWN